MKRLTLALCAATLSCTSAYAQQAPQPAPKVDLTAQQKRLQQCDAEARAQNLKDDAARQEYINDCMKR